MGLWRADTTERLSLTWGTRVILLSIALFFPSFISFIFLVSIFLAFLSFCLWDDISFYLQSWMRVENGKWFLEEREDEGNSQDSSSQQDRTFCNKTIWHLLCIGYCLAIYCRTYLWVVGDDMQWILPRKKWLYFSF